MLGGFWFSTVPPSLEGLVAIDDADLVVPHPMEILLIDLPFEGTDASQLSAVRRLARRPTTRPRLFAALGLVGNIELLKAEEVLGLRVDAFSDRLTPSFLREVQHHGAERIRASYRVDDYRHIARRLNLGCARFHGPELALVWADDTLARLVGFDEMAVHGPEVPLRQLFENDLELQHFLTKVDRVADSGADRATALLRLPNGRDVWATAFRSPDPGRSVILLVHHSPDIDSDQVARDRVAELLEEVGFAYFVCDAAGHTTFCNAKDQKILRTTIQNSYLLSRRDWFADPRDFDAIIAHDSSSPVSKRVLFKTGDNRTVWVEASFRTIKDGDHQPRRIEAAYRDVNLAERLAQAVSDVGALELGLTATATAILDALSRIVDGDSSAIVVWNRDHDRVFPLCLRGAKFGDALVLKDAETNAWFRAHDDGTWKMWPRAQLPRAVVEFFGDNAPQMASLYFLPLPASPDLTTLAIWLAIPERSHSEMSAPHALGTLLQLCQRQLRLATTREAFNLIRLLMSRRFEITTLERLDEFLGRAREALQACLPMEGCSIFRVGIEDRAAILTISTTSGLATPAPGVSYRFTEGMTGTVAQSGERITFEMLREKEFLGKHAERTAHDLLTWAGVPMTDRQKRVVGVIRCANRIVDNAGRSAVTGFSEWDMMILRQFAETCGMLTEPALVDAHRQRTVARIAHEIRSPIVGIRRSLEFLSRHSMPHDERTAAKLANIHLDAAILLNQIRELDVVFNQAGTTAGDPPQLIQLSEIFWNTYFTMIPELNARKIKTSTTRPGEKTSPTRPGEKTSPTRPFEVIGRLPKLWLPPATIAQIIFNLFWNSIKYSHNDPTTFSIVITLEDGGDQFTIKFKDWGIGIDASYRNRIFEENFRTPEARLHDARGLGLGLALSRKLAKDLKGDLTLGRNRDPTEFILTLPRSLLNEPRRPNPSKPPVTSKGPKA